MAFDWSGPNLPTYVDPFSTSAEGGQMGGPVTSKQMGGNTSSRQMGDKHAPQRVPGAVPLSARWHGNAGGQQGGPVAAGQMGGFTYPSQQMG